MEEEVPDVEKAHNIAHYISCEFNSDIQTVTRIVAEDIFRIIYKLANDKQIKSLQSKK